MKRMKYVITCFFVLAMLFCQIPARQLKAEEKGSYSVHLSKNVDSITYPELGYSASDFTVTVPEQDNVEENYSDIFSSQYMVTGSFTIDVTIPDGYDIQYLKVINFTMNLEPLDVTFVPKNGESNVYSCIIPPTEGGYSLGLKDVQYYSVRSDWTGGNYSYFGDPFVKNGEDYIFSIQVPKEDTLDNLILTVNGTVISNNELQKEENNNELFDYANYDYYSYTTPNITDNILITVGDRTASINVYFNDLPEEYTITDTDGNETEFNSLSVKYGGDLTFYVTAPTDLLNYSLFISNNNDRLQPKKITGRENTYSYTIPNIEEPKYINFEEKIKISIEDNVKLIPCTEQGEILEGYENGVSEIYAQKYHDFYFKVTGSTAKYICRNQNGETINEEYLNPGLYSIWVGDENIEINVTALYHVNVIHSGDGDLGVGKGFHSFWNDVTDNTEYYAETDFEFSISADENTNTDNLQVSIKNENGTDIPYRSNGGYDYSAGEYIYHYKLEGISQNLSIEFSGIEYKYSDDDHHLYIYYNKENLKDVNIQVVDDKNNVVQLESSKYYENDEYYPLKGREKYYIKLSGNNLENIIGKTAHMEDSIPLNFIEKDGYLTADISDYQEIILSRGEIFEIYNQYDSGEEYYDDTYYHLINAKDGTELDFAEPGKISFYLEAEPGYSTKESEVSIYKRDINSEEYDAKGEKLDYTVEEKTIGNFTEKIKVYTVEIDSDIIVQTRKLARLPYKLNLPESTDDITISGITYNIYDTSEEIVSHEELEGIKKDGKMQYTGEYGRLYYFTVTVEKGVIPYVELNGTDLEGKAFLEIPDGEISDEEIENSDTEKITYNYRFRLKGNTDISITADGKEITLKAIDAENNGEFEDWSDGEWCYYDSNKNEKMYIEGLPKVISSHSTKTVNFYIRYSLNDAYNVDESRLDEIFTAYSEGDTKGTMLRHTDIERNDDFDYVCYHYSLPAGCTTLEANMSAIQKKSVLVKISSNVNGLTIAPQEGYSYPGNAQDGYQVYGGFYFQITAENEDLLDSIKISSDKNRPFFTEAVNDGLTRYYQVWNVTEDTQLTIGYQSSLKLINDKENVTLESALFNGDTATGLSSGQKVRLIVRVKEGYDAGTVKVTQMIKKNDKEEVNEISLKDSTDSLCKECEITLAEGENVIKVAEPEKGIYKITLPNDTAYTVVPQGDHKETFEFGDRYSFKVNISEGYDAANMTVMVNGKKLIPNSEGIYTIQNINENCIITVEGVEKIKDNSGTKKYTVTFKDHDGKTLKTESIEEGKTATAPKAPERTGYTFTGWDKGFDKINSDTTITATYKQILVSKITLTGLSKNIAAGKSVSLTAKVAPTNALESSLSWESSNTKYATVSSSGKVTTKKAGAGKKVTITASAKDESGVTAVYQINIMKKSITKIKISVKNKSVKAGKKIKITAKVTPSKNVNKTLIWSSSNEKYAVVNSKGVVTAKKTGKGKSVKITAKAADGSGKKASVKIKITK